MRKGRFTKGTCVWSHMSRMPVIRRLSAENSWQCISYASCHHNRICRKNSLTKEGLTVGGVVLTVGESGGSWGSWSQLQPRLGRAKKQMLVFCSLSLFIQFKIPVFGWCSPQSWWVFLVKILPGMACLLEDSKSCPVCSLSHPLTEAVPVSLHSWRERPSMSVFIIHSHIQECCLFKSTWGWTPPRPGLWVRFSLRPQL